MEAGSLPIARAHFRLQLLHLRAVFWLNIVLQDYMCNQTTGILLRAGRGEQNKLQLQGKRHGGRTGLEHGRAVLASQDGKPAG